MTHGMMLLGRPDRRIASQRNDNPNCKFVTTSLGDRYRLLTLVSASTSLPFARGLPQVVRPLIAVKLRFSYCAVASAVHRLSCHPRSSRPGYIKGPRISYWKRLASCAELCIPLPSEMFFSTFFLLFWTVFTWTVRIKRDDVGDEPAAGPYAKIDPDYHTLEEVREALQVAGFESSNLIIGVDFTRSNEWTGRHCFNGRSLHHVGDSPNPYEQAIDIIGNTLSAFDEDSLIPCFGFGDTSTHDRDVFSFYRDRRPCNGVSEALQRYREIAPLVRLSGPTSLAPIIETATRIVENSGHQYHILLIIADGQVPTNAHSEETRSENYLEERTLQALIHASNFPLSIVLVGVGDGPWDDLINCHDNRRRFDNFQFVDFTKIMSKETSQAEKEEQFALEALMKIPTQFSAVISKRISDLAERAPPGRPLPPPC